ncbi:MULTISPECIES: rod shape-determining protein MreD [Enterococcus]|uniref:Rod shape-determining protein MreD n=2 Tax=root TaxID=1 RepID=A0A179EPK9_ENTTH|nr:rod shape-determining protein MreD [Enterococcus thailandicus]ASZ08509.1 rod shape-determining protein MreD [Enterococcus thailandicus]MDA3965363.1 rod shape-determining protein MreD [Enterococcus thailandicus]MDA3974681.1 rod shape-determining protein MreD [Enterococcus thailandicus]MDA3977167.1 rod shape-determining protein MreD [Enterococcus thailandicus]MDA3982051.1 rod shape-determining protein MreD [Enterococcus thailandicus]
MLKKETMKYYLPVILFFLMLLDGQVTRVLGEWTKGVYMANAHFLILALLFCSLSFSKRYLLITTIVLGAIFDMYYIGVIGIYAVALPLIVFIMYSMSQIIHTNIFTEFFSMIIFVTGYELFTLIIQLIFKLAIVNKNYFITQFLGPTLLLNMIIFAIFVFPFKKLFSDE